MPKYVIKADLPEVLSGPYGTLEVDGEAFDISGVWRHPQRWLDKGHAYLAIAEYLEANKPKLPAEPGSVILATKIKDYSIKPQGIYISLRVNDDWASLTFNQTFKTDDIEEWVSVTLSPNEAAVAK